MMKMKTLGSTDTATLVEDTVDGVTIFHVWTVESDHRFYNRQEAIDFFNAKAAL